MAQKGNVCLKGVNKWAEEKSLYRWPDNIKLTLNLGYV